MRADAVRWISLTALVVSVAGCGSRETAWTPPSVQPADRLFAWKEDSREALLADVRRGGSLQTKGDSAADTRPDAGSAGGSRLGGIADRAASRYDAWMAARGGTGGRNATAAGEPLVADTMPAQATAPVEGERAIAAQPVVDRKTADALLNIRLRISILESRLASSKPEDKSLIEARLDATRDELKRVEASVRPADPVGGSQTEASSEPVGTPPTVSSSDDGVGEIAVSPRLKPADGHITPVSAQRTGAARGSVPVSTGVRVSRGRAQADVRAAIQRAVGGADTTP